MKTEEQIKDLAYKRYGTDPHSFGGQRDGFREGYRMCQESLKDNWIKIESEDDLPKNIKGIGTHPKYYTFIDNVVVDDVTWNFVHKQWQKPRYGHYGLEAVFPTHYMENLQPVLPKI